MEETNTSASVPQAVLRPNASDTLNLGWATMKKFFPELLLILLILFLFSLPLGLVNTFMDQDSFGHVFYSIFNVFYGLIIMAPLGYGARYLYLKAVRGEAFNVNEIFIAFRQTLQIALANLLVAVIVGLGIILLIVPGIIFACRLSMVPYLMMEKKLQAVEAVRQSWEITRGHAGAIFWLGFICFWLAIAGLCCLIVGIIPAIIWISLAFAAMYKAIGGQEPGSQEVRRDA